MEHRVHEQQGLTVVELIGDIDGTIAGSLAAIRVAAKSRSIVFDCGKITRINSVGIAHWMAAMKQFDGTTYRYGHCTEQFIDVAVMIPQFPCEGWIESVRLEYYCETCEKATRVDLAAEGGVEIVERVEAPRACSTCGGPVAPLSDIVESLATLAERACFAPRR